MKKKFPCWVNVGGNILRLVLMHSREATDPMRTTEDAVVVCEFSPLVVKADHNKSFWITTVLLQRDHTVCNFSVNASIALSVLCDSMLAVARPNSRLSRAAALVWPQPHQSCDQKVGKAEVSTLVTQSQNGVYWVGGGPPHGEPHHLHVIDSVDDLKHLQCEQFVYPDDVNHTFFCLTHHEPVDDARDQQYSALSVRTWHRGLKNWVQCSGTGAAAVAAYALKHLVASKCRIEFEEKASAHYKVTTNWLEDSVMTKVRLCVPVEFYSRFKSFYRNKVVPSQLHSREDSFPSLPVLFQNSTQCNKCIVGKKQCFQCKRNEWEVMEKNLRLLKSDRLRRSRPSLPRREKDSVMLEPNLVPQDQTQEKPIDLCPPSPPS